MAGPSIALLSNVTTLVPALFECRTTTPDIQMAGPSITLLSNVTGTFDIQMAGDGGDGILVVLLFAVTSIFDGDQYV